MCNVILENEWSLSWHNQLSVILPCMVLHCGIPALWKFAKYYIYFAFLSHATPQCCSLMILYIPSETVHVRCLCVLSPAFPGLLGQAHWAWALLGCLQPPGRAVVLGHAGPGSEETLPLCRRSPMPAPGVSVLHLREPNVLNLVFPVKWMILSE